MSSDFSDANAAEQSLINTGLSEREARITDAGLFFRKFVAKGRGISSAVPSSRSMARTILRVIDWSKPATIVELGAGTGPITEIIVQNLRPHHRFVMVESDPDFCGILRRRFPEVPLLEGDATKIEEPLAALGITKVDYIVSGLPTPNLPKRAAVRLSRWMRKNLKANGYFLQITVAPLVYRTFYDRVFKQVDYSMVWRNVPPGGVYFCSRPRKSLHVKK